MKAEENQAMNFKMKLAGMIFSVDGIHPELERYCRDYLVKEEETFKEQELPHERIKITPEMVLAEQKETEGGMTAGALYSDSYLETLALLRQITKAAALHDRFLCHGAAITWRDHGYLFTAPSGTGKTTHISLWKQYLGDEVEIVNGDKPLVEACADGFRVYGTPWAGKERWQKNRSMLLNGICVICRAKKNTIRRLTPLEAMPMMIRQIYFTEEPEKAGRIMELLDRLLSEVPVYELCCDISHEAVKVSFEALTGTKIKE